MSIKARIELLRHQGMGLLDAKRLAEKEAIIESIEASTTIEQLKPLMIWLVEQNN
jgi:hypothetical protein